MIGRTPGLALVLLAILLFSACSGKDGGGMTPTNDPDGDGIAGAADQCPTQKETVNGVFDRDGCPDTPQDLYQAVRNDVEAFWNLYFNNVIFRSYFRTAGIQMFSGPIQTPCGGGQGPFYCGLDFVVYLDQPFMDGQLTRIGDFAPAVIIAHEIGHHTQNLLGLLNTISIAKELQADCLAGAWSASAGARGLVDAGDFQEAARSLFLAADPAGTPWFAPGAHGTSQQRLQAYTTGLLQGAIGCG